MKKLIVFLVFISLIIIKPAIAETGYPYWPMRFGSEITYARYKVSVNVNPITLEIAVISRQFVDYVPVLIAHYTCQNCFGSAVALREVFPDHNYLVEAGAVHDGVEYIGEIRNPDGTMIFPPIAKLAKEPWVGQVISAYSTLVANCGFFRVTVGDHFWVYTTIDHYDTWGEFEDCWRTGLTEWNQSYYNYVFSRGVGLVHFWYTHDGATGYEFYSVDY